MLAIKWENPALQSNHIKVWVWLLERTVQINKNRYLIFSRIQINQIKWLKEMIVQTFSTFSYDTTVLPKIPKDLQFFFQKTPCSMYYKCTSWGGIGRFVTLGKEGWSIIITWRLGMAIQADIQRVNVTPSELKLLSGSDAGNWED